MSEMRNYIKTSAIRSALQTVTESLCRWCNLTVSFLIRDRTKQLCHPYVTDENGNTDVVEVKAGTGLYQVNYPHQQDIKVDKNCISLKIEAGKDSDIERI